jgi:hypothetical protein
MGWAVPRCASVCLRAFSIATAMVRGRRPFKGDTVPLKVNGVSGYNDGQNQFNAVYKQFYID